MKRFGTHIDGDVCESIAAEHFIRAGCLVFITTQNASPIDLVVIDEDNVRLLQIKKDNGRINPGRTRNSRIHRVRSAIQKKLGVEMVYVDIKTRSVFTTDHDYHKNRRKRVTSKTDD